METLHGIPLKFFVPHNVHENDLGVRNTSSCDNLPPISTKHFFLTSTMKQAYLYIAYTITTERPKSGLLKTRLHVRFSDLI